MARNGVVAVLDVGSSKVVCFVAYLNGSGQIRIVGIGHQVSEGIRGGIIVDAKKAEESILAAVGAAEKMSGEVIDTAWVSVSGSGLQSHLMQVEASISGHEVTDRDVQHILRQGYGRFEKGDAEVVHCIPVEYSIDSAYGITNPRGMFGDVLRTDLHVITAPSTGVRNLTHCLAHCHLDIDGYVTAPYMSGLSTLTEDEKQLGAIVLDIGGSNTSIGLFAQGQPVYTANVPLGGMHVTRDVARGLSTSLTYAERMKTLYGTVVSAMADNKEVIDIPLADMQSDIDVSDGAPIDDSYITKGLLTSIICPRMEEILEMARDQLKASGVYHLAGPRLVLTGGGSQLQGVRELAGHIFGKHARIGRPCEVDGMAEVVKNPAFATSVGMLLHAAEARKGVGAGGLGDGKEVAVKKEGMARFVSWFKENF